ncbi:MAG TPA: hypothetical protein VK518_23005, partial [Puia sp.]|nr:hypothetical protein [Puia sp.]
FNTSENGQLRFVPVRMLTAVLTGWLIAHILYKRDHLSWPFSLVLNNKLLIFLGKISYGIYLYHPIIRHYTPRTILTNLNKHIPVLGDYLLFIEQNSLVILAAWISWRLIERPVLVLKKYFVLPGKASKLKKELPEKVMV